MAQHHHEVSGNRLGITVLLNVLITTGELIGGILSGSMALVTDAAHNFSDVLALVISYLANKLAQKKATARQTFGYARSEILAAFANSVTLIVIALIILYEATLRLYEPVAIKSNWVIWLAAGSILLNGLSVLLIRDDAQHSMNMRSSLVHLLGDMMTSIAVLIGGLLMQFFHWPHIDAIFSIIIAVYLIYMSWNIFIKSLGILMQFVPRNLNIEDLCKEVASIEGIDNIHHVHCWQLDDHSLIFEAHVDFHTDIALSEFEAKLKVVREVLAKHKIYHSNIQPEFNVRDNKELIQAARH